MSNPKRNSEQLIIAVDFDGTVVTHEYPDIGKDIGAVPVLKELVAAGHKLILFTMRSHKIVPGCIGQTVEALPQLSTLSQAVAWFRDNDIPLWDVNRNPGQGSWTSSSKVYAHLYIDDAAVGIPLVSPPEAATTEEVSRFRPYVDWVALRAWFVSKQILPPIGSSGSLLNFQTRQFLQLGWAYLNHIADDGYCGDRSCHRCRIADALFELEARFEKELQSVDSKPS